jgi:hypothetical protein
MEDSPRYLKPDKLKKFGRIVTDAKAIVVTGEVQKEKGVTNVVGKDFRTLDLIYKDVKIKTRNFR